MLTLLSPTRPATLRAAPSLVHASLINQGGRGVVDSDAPTAEQQRVAYRGLVASLAKLRATAVAGAMLGATVERKRAGDEYEPVEPAHPWVSLLSSPHPSWSPRLIWNWAQQAKDLGRGAFFFVERDGSGRPLYLHPVFPSFGEVRPIGAASGEIEDYAFHRADGRVVRWDGRDVVWLRHPHPVSPYESASLLEISAYEADSDLYAKVYRRDLMKNGGFPRLQAVTPEELTPAQVSEAEDALIAKVWNQARTRKIPVFSKGAKLEPIGVSAEDMQYVATSELTRTELYEIWGVPEGLKTKDATFANATQAARTFAQWTVQPEADDNADQLTAQLRRAYDAKDGRARERVAMLVVRAPDVVPLDPDFAMKQDEMHLRTGQRLLNELRERDGYDPFGPAGNVPMVSAMLAPLSLVAGDTGDDAPPADTTPDVPEAEAPEVQEGAAVPELVLNGAQVQAALEIIGLVATGGLPRETGVQALVTFFNLEANTAEALMGEVGKGFAVDKPAPPPQFMPPDEPDEEPEDEDDEPRAACSTREDDALTLEWRAVDAQKTKAARPVRAAAAAYLRAMRDEIVARIEAGRSGGNEARAVTVDAVFDMDEWLRRLESDLGPAVLGAIRQGFLTGALRIGDAGVSVTYDAGSPAVRRALARSLAKAQSIPSTMRGVVQDEIATALASGEDVAAMASRVRALFDSMEEWKAEQIARTTGHAGFEGGQVASYAEAGVGRKRWLSQRDGLVRPEHDAMDGEEVGTEEAFSNGEEYPSSPNCRCTTLPVLSDEPRGGATGTTWRDERDARIRAAYPALRDAEGGEAAMHALGLREGLSYDQVRKILYRKNRKG